jgi:multiple sugar transport system permease protein
VFIVSRKRFKKFFQMAYYSPAVLSSVVVASIWLLIFDPRGLSNQLVNFILNTPGVDHKWLANSAMVQMSTMLVYFWKYVGYFTIIFLVGLASIPQSIHEAAKMDGINAWTGFWYITLPLLKPTTILVSIMSMLQCLKTFSTQYLFTQGGAPMEPINVITLNLYHTAIRDHRIGLASAMSIILFCIMLFFTWLQFKGSRSDEVSY